MLALRACDGLERNREACKKLVTEALKVLPQAKRKQLQRFVKTQSILVSKEHKRAGKGLDSADQGLVLADLAPDLVAAVFSHLGPCSLAVAACVCRTWRTDASKESRWRSIYEKAHGIPVRAESFTSRKHYFRDSVAEIFKGKGRQCLPYRSGRRLRDGCPIWLDDSVDHDSSPLLCLFVKEVTAYIVEGKGFALPPLLRGRHHQVHQHIGPWN
ncbi:g9724 [Coccomyxa elongata]